VICSGHIEIEFAAVALFSWEGERMSIPLTWGMISQLARPGMYSLNRWYKNSGSSPAEAGA
jgi:hypothetical protein